MIKAIYIASKHKQPLRSVDSIECEAGQGIWGDRNFGKMKWPGQNITLIESEAISAYNRKYQQNIAWDAPRRNLITQGVALNDLVGQQFQIGDVVLLGVELCEPCKLLAQDLSNENITQSEVIQAFSLSGGLRADIITSGNISIGDTIKSI